MSHKPVKLLVSVRDRAEATDALLGGADWVDCKEPESGPLGAVLTHDAKLIAAAVAGDRPLSAAMGELLDWPNSPAQELLAVTGIQVVKLGLARCRELSGWQAQWRQVFEVARAARKELAAVIYADWQVAGAPTPEHIIDCASEAGCQYLLVDTFVKQSSTSLDIFSAEVLDRLLQFVHQAGMTTVLAGNLQAEDFAQVAKLPVDVIAVRSAACRDHRCAAIDKNLVHDLHARLNAINAQ